MKYVGLFVRRNNLVILMWLLYLFTHSLAFYLYYNPPKDTWIWVKKITVFLPQLGGLMELKRIPFSGDRLAIMFAVTYVPAVVLGFLLMFHSNLISEKKQPYVSASNRIVAVLGLISLVVFVHYILYWTSFGFERASNILHPGILSLIPIPFGSFMTGAICIAFKFFQGKQK